MEDEAGGLAVAEKAQRFAPWRQFQSLVHGEATMTIAGLSPKIDGH
jgi:hypothetical protein